MAWAVVRVTRDDPGGPAAAAATVPAAPAAPSGAAYERRVVLAGLGALASASPAADLAADDEPGAGSSDDAPGPTSLERAAAEKAAILERFTVEGRNPSWASRAEADLEQSFLDYLAGHAPEGVDLDRVECRTSHCRIELSYSSMRSAATLQGDLFNRTVFATPCVIHSLGIETAAAGADSHQTLVVACSEWGGVAHGWM
jgi:hypothetical protein